MLYVYVLNARIMIQLETGKKKKRPKAASLVQWPKAIEPGATRKRLARPSALVPILNLAS